MLCAPRVATIGILLLIFVLMIPAFGFALSGGLFSGNAAYLYALVPVILIIVLPLIFRPKK